MKKYVILDTDWGDDVDDVVAARLLCNAHKQGEIELIGCVINAATPESVRALDGFLLHAGVDVPVGVDRAATGTGSSISITSPVRSAVPIDSAKTGIPRSRSSALKWASMSLPGNTFPKRTR